MNKNMENLEKETTTTQQPLNMHEEPQQQNSIFDNILKAFAAASSLSPLLFNGTFNYESILNNSVLTPPLTPLLLQQAAQLAAAMSTNSSPKSSSPNLSIEIPPSPTDGFTLPWLISSLSSSIDNAQVNTSSDSSSGQSTPRSAKQSHIKRPMNGFMIWAREERRRIVEGSKLNDANSCLHNSQISKILGARWRTLTKEEKAPYFEEQARQKQLHHEKHPDYQYKPKKRRTRAIDGKRISLKEYNEVVKINKSMVADLDTGYSKTSLETMTHTAFMRIFAPLVSQQPVN
ncbi:hypothetical protein CAEBREN_25924 [Caenorhabditis brenneri]|uniref:HMG box domain-containing protein n=1 Tax=Caenorhabditis brenneri TaxID=135651 RepID=G0PGR2_CAEBE|nr:hypothetical protein CAEBREN_25924 [Caenorhabditis brenneri]